MFLDGTFGLTLPILLGTANMSQISSTALMAISFRVNESDASCGPGRYSISQVAIAASQVSTAVVSITVQLFGANVSFDLLVHPRITKRKRYDFGFILCTGNYGIAYFWICRIANYFDIYSLDSGLYCNPF